MDSGINPILLLQNLGYLADIVQAIAVFLGLGLFMAGLFKLKRYGEMRTFMSHQMTIAAPLLMLFSGIAMMCLPIMLHTALLNIWGVNNPMRYTGSGDTTWEQLIPGIIAFVRIIGVCAFMRGLVLFSRSGSEHGQQGIMARAFLHVLGGTLCINIIGTLHLLKGILGFTSG